MPNRLKIAPLAADYLKKFLLSFLAILLFSGCTTIYNPATQKKETLLIDTESEVALGRDVDKQMQNKLKMIHDPQRQNRLNNIGARLSGVSDRVDLAYHFRIVNDDEFNAFALPGGFIYVNRGLMDAANDDELAGVIGHEIGHIAARHSVKKLQADLGYQIIMSIALGISGQQEIGKATDLAFNVVSLGYSRKDELLADKLAVKYARKADFDPHGMITFFKKLQREEEKKGGNFQLVFLSSHPKIEDRIKNIETEIRLNP